MESYNFTYATTFTDDYFFNYVNGLGLPYSIEGIMAKDSKYITITTDRELTSTEEISLNSKIQEYSDFSQYVINDKIISKAVLWGTGIIKEFKNRNISRKDKGEMARQELLEIIQELHDSFVHMNMIEGSLDTLHGILYGFPEQTIGENTWAAKAPFTFQKVWSEDIDWIKSELNIFLASL